MRPPRLLLPGDDSQEHKRRATLDRVRFSVAAQYRSQCERKYRRGVFPVVET